MDASIFVLGAVRLTVGGTEVRIPGRRERAVLCLLVAARGQALTADRLIEDVWGQDAGESAPASLQVAISRLRSLTEPGRARGAEPRVLLTTAGGYQLRVPAEQVDVERFAGLIDEAGTALEQDRAQAALDLVEQAEQLWKGTPYAQAPDSELIRAEVARLEGLHLLGHELRARARLGLGRPAQAVGDLETLVLEHPFREQLWALLSLAQYRCGRQADALGTLRRARAVLADELGIDPSPALQTLEAEILSQATSLVPGKAEPGRLASSTADLVGRAEVLTQLRGHLDRAVGGRSGTVIVAGEAGIGKTRLAQELAVLAQASGAWVLWGRNHEADYSPPFWPWLSVLRALAPAHPSPLVAGLLNPGEGPAAVDAESAQLRIYEAVSALIAQHSAERALVVVIEDLHWADNSSLRLLTYAAEALSHERVLFVGTLREGEPPTPALRAALGALARVHASRIELTGLPVEEVRDLVARLGGVAVDEELATVIAERTDGNPFFVMELVRLLAAEDQLHAAGAREVQVPHGVQDVVRLRLAGLSAAANRLLRVAAVAGRDFDLTTVAEVSGTDPDVAIDLLDEAVRAHAVEESGVADQYRFTHALVRETVVAELPTARRARLHAAVALALEGRWGADPDQVGELARHFVLGASVRPDLADRAVRYAIAAARQAEGREALDEALRQWEQSLIADGMAGEEQPRRRYEVLLGLGRARHRRGQVVASREALNEAVTLARRLEDTVLIAEAATSYRGAGVWRWREVGMSDQGVIDVLSECADRLPAGELRARVLASLAMELTHDWCSPEAEQISRQALDLARELGDVPLIADVVSLRMLVLWGRPGGAREQLALAEEVLRLPLSHEQELYARFKAAPAHLQVGDVKAADREMVRCTELARRLRHTGADVPIAWWKFYRAVATGDVQAVARTVDRIIQNHRRSEIVALNELESMARLALARPGDPVPPEFEAQAAASQVPVFQNFIAHAVAESGRGARAVQLLAEATPAGRWHYSSMHADCLRVAVLAIAGATGPLRPALEQIRPWGAEFASAGSTEYIGSVEYFIGMGLQALGELDAARAAFERAVAANTAVNAVPWRERAERRLAALPAAPSQEG